MFGPVKQAESMCNPKLTRSRIILAFAIAVIADLIQFPITAVEATGFLAIPAEWADFLGDCIVMGAMTWLLGFHWVLLPSLVLEAVPGLDLLPTWTACVAYVVWLRKKQLQAPPVIRRPATVQEAEIISEPPAASLYPPPPGGAAIPAPPLAEFEVAVDKSLKGLGDLRQKNLITDRIQTQTPSDTGRDLSC